MDLNSTAFAQGGDIPRKYTCEGDDIAPPLSWSDVPERTLSLALIVDDPDAPDPAAPTRTWVHFVLVDIAPGATAIPEGGGPLPEGCRDGLNDWPGSQNLASPLNPPSARKARRNVSWQTSRASSSRPIVRYARA